MSFLKELRERARNCYDTETKMALVDAADKLAGAIELFYADRDYGSMTHLNNAWARAHRIKIVSYRPFSPGGGSQPLTEMQKAA